ncbi:MAG: GNAT family N-acetyltransferase [Angustibacter sp.]
MRPLGPQHRGDVLALCDTDPVAHVTVADRVEADPDGLGGQFWGAFQHDQLVGGCWVGVNVVLVGALGPAALDQVAQQVLVSQGLHSSLFGPAGLVLPLWGRLRLRGWSAREVRADQPMLVIDTPPAVPPDPEVRRATPRDLDDVLPSSIAMFTEEVGYSPIGLDDGAAYRRRVAELLERGCTFVRRSTDGELIFKADLGAMSRAVAQVHGVWVAPRWRGKGLSAPAMAAVVAETLRDNVPVVSLYVNRYNTRAIAAYHRVGFRQVATFATVLL